MQLFGLTDFYLTDDVITGFVIFHPSTKTVGCSFSNFASGTLIGTVIILLGARVK